MMRCVSYLLPRLICQQFVFSLNHTVGINVWTLAPWTQVMHGLLRLTWEQDVSFEFNRQLCHFAPVPVRSWGAALWGAGWQYNIHRPCCPLHARLMCFILNYWLSVWIYRYCSFCSHAGFVMYVIHSICSLFSTYNVYMLSFKKMLQCIHYSVNSTFFHRLLFFVLFPFKLGDHEVH